MLTHNDAGIVYIQHEYILLEVAQDVFFGCNIKGREAGRTDDG
jgi:hypothetical protein